ncbi:hypothetical protein ACFV0Y_01970 [Streptomyces sp. NPDC059569]|uniref:hypothetical protein n=1 Tax=Streptomyces sp. NPDC059569 TaxID=3346869 RepID=UPI003694CFB7
MTYLPHLPAKPVALVTIPAAWNAVTLPASWAGRVLDILGDRSGACLEDDAYRHMMWFIPPGTAATWPDTGALDVRVQPTGNRITLAGPDGHAPTMRWHRTPSTAPLTSAHVLRTAIERIVGPLKTAGQLGPVRPCRYCGTLLQGGILLGRMEFASGADRAWYACDSCWFATGGACPGHHPHALPGEPR